jgi:hypothetical protein
MVALRLSMKEIIGTFGGGMIREGQRYLQQSCAKGQVKNKWLLDSIG